jgi:hypothetical protein
MHAIFATVTLRCVGYFEHVPYLEIISFVNVLTDINPINNVTDTP